MIKSAVKKHIEKELPDRLVNELFDLSRKYADRGARLFIFGSFARSRNKKTSDLDLGVIWTKERSSRTFTELYRDVQNLSTIRKIDLVDMSLVEESFKNKAINEAFFLNKEKTA